MLKALYAALMAVCLILIAFLTLAGFFWMIGAPGLHPGVALVGIIGASIVGAWAGIMIDGEEESDWV